MFRRIILNAVLLAAVLCVGSGRMPCAAQTVTLSPDSLFRLIDTRSHSIRLKSLCVEDAAEGQSAARSSRLPVISASLSVGYLGNGYLTDRDFSDGMAVHNPHSNNNFALDAMQMIYSGGAISGGIRLAELNANMARLDLEQNRQQVRFVMLGWLTDLQCLHNRRRVLNENIELAGKVIKDMQARYEEGVVLKSDLTRYELQQQDLMLQRDRTDEAIRTTNYRLANALGYPAGTTEFVPAIPAGDADSDIAPEQSWQERALTSSLSLQKARLGIEMSEADRKVVASDRLPKLSLFAYGRFDSPIVTEVPVLDKNFMYWGFGVSLSYNISSIYTSRHKVRRADTVIRESREAYDMGLETVRNDVQAAFESYRTAVTELRTQEKSLELARQNYDIISDRFANGMALVTDMVDAANVRLSAEIGLDNARTMLRFCYYRLQYVTDSL